MIPAPEPSKLLTLVVVLLALIAAALILKHTQAPIAPEKRSDSEHTQETQFFTDTDLDPVLGLPPRNQASHQAGRIPVVVL